VATDNTGEELTDITISEPDVNPAFTGGLVGFLPAGDFDHFSPKSENTLTDLDFRTIFFD
jgi:hypothetical protein